MTNISWNPQTRLHDTLTTYSDFRLVGLSMDVCNFLSHKSTYKHNQIICTIYFPSCVLDLWMWKHSKNSEVSMWRNVNFRRQKPSIY